GGPAGHGPRPDARRRRLRGQAVRSQGSDGSDRPAAPVLGTMASSGKRIAVLDDDESFQDYLKSLFELRGHKVRPYSTPGAFLDGATRFKPDLIVLDLHLPNVDGWQFLKTLRAVDAFKNVPVVLVTGVRRRAPDVVAGFEQG